MSIILFVEIFFSLYIDCLKPVWETVQFSQLHTPQNFNHRLTTHSRNEQRVKSQRQFESSNINFEPFFLSPLSSPSNYHSHLVGEKSHNYSIFNVTLGNDQIPSCSSLMDFFFVPSSSFTTSIIIILCFTRVMLSPRLSRVFVSLIHITVSVRFYFCDFFYFDILRFTLVVLFSLSFIVRSETRGHPNIYISAATTVCARRGDVKETWRGNELNETERV